jgi:hypothetical protein
LLKRYRIILASETPFVVNGCFIRVTRTRNDDLRTSQ